MPLSPQTTQTSPPAQYSLMRWWAYALPLAAAVLTLLIQANLLSVGHSFTSPAVLACLVALSGSVLAAVHHAETVAHKVGEPYGTLILALAVTVIEAALIVSMMLNGGANAHTLARDAIYAAVMIIITGVLGLCLLLGALRHREQSFRVEGINGGLSALMVLSTLSLILPTVTTTTSSGTFSDSQLVFVAIFSFIIWLAFVFVQTIKHRDYFLPITDTTNAETHAAPPSARAAWIALCFLLIALVVVVLLAKKLSPAIEATLVAARAPAAMLGIVIALLVLLPETLSAARAAQANRLQTSFNLAIGSALACIGLTIPVVIVLALWLDLPLTLGLSAKNIVLLALSFAITMVTFAHGRSNVLQGVVHLIVFAAYLFLSWVP